MFTARWDTIIFEYFLAVFLGCDCDESLPNANDFCPRRQVWPRTVDLNYILTFYWRNARNVSVSKQAASAIPMLSILMSCVPAMSSASTVNVSRLVIHHHFLHIWTFSLDQVATVTSTLLIQTAFVSLERFARWVKHVPDKCFLSGVV